jgi:hypothetical protein
MGGYKMLYQYAANYDQWNIPACNEKSGKQLISVIIKRHTKQVDDCLVEV